MTRNQLNLNSQHRRRLTELKLLFIIQRTVCLLHLKSWAPSFAWMRKVRDFIFEKTAEKSTCSYCGIFCKETCAFLYFVLIVPFEQNNPWCLEIRKGLHDQYMNNFSLGIVYKYLRFIEFSENSKYGYCLLLRCVTLDIVKYAYNYIVIRSTLTCSEIAFKHVY